MWTMFQGLFSSSGYMPHGSCYLWQTPLVTLHVVSDVLIALAYFSIPSMLIYFVWKRNDVPFLRFFVLFGAFIIFCGIGHLIEVWTLWIPAYWISGIEQAATALISCYTAAEMVVQLPLFLSLKRLPTFRKVTLPTTNRDSDRSLRKESLKMCWSLPHLRILVEQSSLREAAFFSWTLYFLARNNPAFISTANRETGSPATFGKQRDERKEGGGGSETGRRQCSRTPSEFLMIGKMSNRLA